MILIKGVPTGQSYLSSQSEQPWEHPHIWFFLKNGPSLKALWEGIRTVQNTAYKKVFVEIKTGKKI